MTDTTFVQELAQNACHFGHKVSRWNPKMAPYLWGKRGGIHIFDLEKTAKHLEGLLKTVEQMTKDGKVILFVSTKPQTRVIFEEILEKKGYPIVHKKWVGGLLTNFNTIQKRIRRLKDLRELIETGEIDKFPKKEQAGLKKERAKLEEAFSGIVDMYRKPDAVFMVDGARDNIAIKEALRLKIPVLGIADSNVDPSEYTDFVPANDDAITALTYMLQKVYEALEPCKSQQPRKRA